MIMIMIMTIVIVIVVVVVVAVVVGPRLGRLGTQRYAQVFMVYR